MEQIGATLSNKSADNSLPGNTFFLENGDVLCCDRESGVSRYPYQDDGFTLWAYSNGYIFATESVLDVFRYMHMDNDSSVNFFVGIPNGDGTYFPVSVLGSGRQLFEPFTVNRYLVYARSAAYYIADLDIATFCVRVSVPENKKMSFSFIALNKTDKPLDYTLNTYFESLLSITGPDVSFWDKDQRKSIHIGEGRFLMNRTSYCQFNQMLLEREKVAVKESYFTTSRPEFTISQAAGICNAQSLKLGKFKKQSFDSKYVTSVAAEILHLTTTDSTRIEYLFTISGDRELNLKEKSFLFDRKALDEILENKESSEKERLSNTLLAFDDWTDGVLNVKVLNNFIKNLQKQVDFCAMGKNYVGTLLGIRDVFQQLEQAIIWSPEMARERMIRALGFIDPSGRPPRQISLPQYEGHIPQMDLRAFIDQGNWILTTFFMYLAYTDDYAVLQDECGYFEIEDADRNLVKYTDLKNSVLEHLLRITDYLISNIDHEYGTNCLRIVHGDWNDAIDGIGRSLDKDKRYGSGVSVMASLQLYRNLKEMVDILQKIGGYDEKTEHYLTVRRDLAEGLKKYAIEKNEKGEIRLIHGWGDKLSYKIGSFNDPDGASRLSFAPFAYWAISDLISETPELKSIIRDNLLALDSTHGLLTNYPAFPSDMYGVGRIATITPGFSENACAYVHASMFSIAALFLTGDSENAWRQIEKSIIINHPNCDKTPFVMPNSYCRNLELCVEETSQSDWFTGSGTVLYKNLFRFGFGIEPNLDGLTIQTAATMPSSKASAKFQIKGRHITLIYENLGNGKREIALDGVKAKTCFDPLMQTEKLFIPTEKLTDGMVITVTD